jgi:hypothetical protein
MRGAFLVVVLILTLIPAPDAAAAPIRPQLYVQLSTTNANVTSLVDKNVTVTIGGNVTARKLSFMRVTVQLTSNVDTGWSSSVSPSSMVITDEVPHPFTCDVIVPMNTQSISTILEVDATYSGAGGTYFDTATITVTKAPLTNQTALNQSVQNQSAKPPSQTGVEKYVAGLNNTNILWISATGLITSVAGIVTFVTIRKRKTIRN